MTPLGESRAGDVERARARARRRAREQSREHLKVQKTDRPGASNAGRAGPNPEPRSDHGQG
jgi:hypothetical protein